jgi:hypothetical protein
MNGRKASARVAAAAIALVIVLPACSSKTSTDPGTTSVGSTTAPPSSTPGTDAPATTADVATTVVPPAGWTVADDSATAGVSYAMPCCGDDFHGTPSPALPADGAPLADGQYFVRRALNWGDTPMELQVYRFEACAALPADSCEDPSGVDNMGVDFSTYAPLTISADDPSLRVVLVGFTGFDSGVPDKALGTVADLFELVDAVDAAYATVFYNPFLLGESPDDIVADVMAAPTGGFQLAPEGAGLVTFVHDGAPPLLFQYLFDLSVSPPQAIRGSDVLGLNAITVSGSQITLYVYAGYYP